MVTKTTKLSVLLLAGLFSACSTVKDMTNVDLWPFGKGSEQGHEYMPANSVSFACEGNKKFYEGKQLREKVTQEVLSTKAAMLAERIKALHLTTKQKVHGTKCQV